MLSVTPIFFNSPPPVCCFLVPILDGWHRVRKFHVNSSVVKQRRLPEWKRFDRERCIGLLRFFLISVSSPDSDTAWAPACWLVSPAQSTIPFTNAKNKMVDNVNVLLCASNHFVIEFAKVVAAFNSVIVIGSVRFRFQCGHWRGPEALGSPQFAYRPDGHWYCASRSVGWKRLYAGDYEGKRDVWVSYKQKRIGSEHLLPIRYRNNDWKSRVVRYI